MRLLNSIVVIGVAMSLAACGGKTSDDKKDGQGTPELTSELESAAPEAAIIRVPVDENGEPVGAPEMRIFNGEPSALEGEYGLESAFESSKVPVNVVTSEDELDFDTSTQSWYGYEGYRSYEGYRQNGYGHGPRTDYKRYGKDYWHKSYKPVYYSKGFGWKYKIYRDQYRPHHQFKRGYRYYCYRRYGQPYYW